MDQIPARTQPKTARKTNIDTLFGVVFGCLLMLPIPANLPSPHAVHALGWFRWIGLVFWLYVIVRLSWDGADGNRPEHRARLFGCLAAAFFVVWQVAGFSPDAIAVGSESLRLAYIDFGILPFVNSGLVFCAARLVTRPLFRLAR